MGTSPAEPAALRLYVREGCHLCDDFHLELGLDLGPAVAGVTLVDVDSDPRLAALYGLRVPVLEAPGGIVCEGRYDRERVRQALRL